VILGQCGRRKEEANRKWAGWSIWPKRVLGKIKILYIP
jgi:hypothetical protein